FGVSFLALWEAAVRGFDLKPYFLAAPSKIFEQFFKNYSRIWEASMVSGGNALVGLIVGTVFGVAMSFILSRYRFLGELITPLAIALNAIPIFVLVAVLNNMYSITSEIPRRVMVTLVVYFIVLVNVAKGLTQVRSTHVELMRSYRRKRVCNLAQSASTKCCAVFVYGAKSCCASLGDYGFCQRIFWRSSKRLRKPNYEQYRQRQKRCGVGLRFRGVPAWASVLHSLHYFGECHSQG
ncbi:MAG: hypothetical protein RIT00_1256, partial [Actinomycetota bacterium]